jgi:hypothetical protein
LPAGPLSGLRAGPRFLPRECGLRGECGLRRDGRLPGECLLPGQRCLGSEGRPAARQRAAPGRFLAFAVEETHLVACLSAAAAAG